MPLLLPPPLSSFRPLALADDLLQVSERVLGAVYGALSEASVFLEGTLLKPQMIMAGVDAPEKKVWALLLLLRFLL